jgi:hypothetical protein
MVMDRISGETFRGVDPVAELAVTGAGPMTAATPNPMPESQATMLEARNVTPQPRPIVPAVAQLVHAS